MNLIRYTRDFVVSFWGWLMENALRIKEQIIATFTISQRNLGMV